MEEARARLLVLIDVSFADIERHGLYRASTPLQPKCAKIIRR